MFPCGERIDPPRHFPSACKVTFTPFIHSPAATQSSPHTRGRVPQPPNPIGGRSDPQRRSIHRVWCNERTVDVVETPTILTDARDRKILRVARQKVPLNAFYQSVEVRKDPSGPTAEALDEIRSSTTRLWRDEKRSASAASSPSTLVGVSTAALGVGAMRIPKRMLCSKSRRNHAKERIAQAII